MGITGDEFGRARKRRRYRRAYNGGNSLGDHLEDRPVELHAFPVPEDPELLAGILGLALGEEGDG